MMNKSIENKSQGSSVKWREQEDLHKIVHNKENKKSDWPRARYSNFWKNSLANTAKRQIDDIH
jgi:hypothetical protein